jgi:hypothetical protein
MLAALSEKLTGERLTLEVWKDGSGRKWVSSDPEGIVSWLPLTAGAASEPLTSLACSEPHKPV